MSSKAETVSRLWLEKDVVTEEKAQRNGEFMALKAEEQGHEEKGAGGIQKIPLQPDWNTALPTP